MSDELPPEDGMPSRGSDYRAARIGVAFGLTVAVVVLLIADALNDHYSVDPIILGFMLTTIMLLLGIEGVDLLRRRGP